MLTTATVLKGQCLIPKGVLVFSPHPDDDVISMGGTLQRLVDQNHEVHVVYQTSGNIAVSDDDVIHIVSLIQHLTESISNDSDLGFNI